MQDYRTIIDIGANMGSFAVYAALTCPNAIIYCFEPEKQNFEILKKNIAINSLEPRVRAFQCAVASSNENREMAIGQSPLNSLVTKELSEDSNGPLHDATGNLQTKQTRNSRYAKDELRRSRI